MKERLEMELDAVDKIKDEHGEQKIEAIKDVVKLISQRIKDLRELHLNQTFAMNKFFKEAGDDWRNSRLVYAISSVQATIYQIKLLLSGCLI